MAERLGCTPRPGSLKWPVAAVSIDMARTVGGHTTDAVTIRHCIDPRIAFTRSAADVLPRLLPYEVQEPEAMVLDVLPEPAALDALPQPAAIGVGR